MAADIIGQAGSATARQWDSSTWHSVDFDVPLDDPIVVAGPVSLNGGDPVTVRVRDVTDTGFEWQIDEYNYLDGAHATETVDWFAVERGTHVLADGRRIVAESTGRNHVWAEVELDGFDAAPAVFAQVASDRGGDAVVIRTRGVDANGFEIRLDEEEKKDRTHLFEKIHYIAMSHGGGEGWDVGVTGNSVTHRNFEIEFEPGVADDASVLAFMQTFDGGDTASIRLRDRTDGDAASGPSATIFVEEERSKDNEVAHTTEAVAYAAIPPGLLSAPAFVFPADSGVVDVTNLPAEVLDANPGLVSAVAGDGIDDTAAIQAALDFYPASNRIIYVPNGVYDVSDTIRWPNGDPNTGGDDAKLLTLQGQSRDGVVLRLADGLAPGTDDYLPVINTGFAPAQRFANNVRDLTIDTGRDNPGAVGAEYIANNRGTFRDVLIRSGDGQGRIGLSTSYTAENGPALIKNVEVVGFDFGITASSNEYGLTFEDIVLTDQNIAAVRNKQQSPQFRNLSVAGDAAVVVMAGPGGSLHIAGGTFENTGSATLEAAVRAEENTAVFLQDVTAIGYENVFASLQNNTVDFNGIVDYGVTTGTHGVDSIDLFVSSDPTNAFDGGAAELIGIQPVQTPNPSLETDVSQWANVMDFGANPYDTIDDTAAFQAAIDSGATTVYLPNLNQDGSSLFYFRIDGDLVVRGAVERITGFEGRIGGEGSITIADGDADLLTWERIRVLSSAPGVSNNDLTFHVETARDVLVRHSSFAAAGFAGDVDRFSFSGADASSTISIEAETYDQGEGVGVFAGGTVVGSIIDRDSVRYDAVDFGDGGLDTFTARLSSLNDGSRLQVRLGSEFGPVVAEADFPQTGSFATFADVSVDLATDITGVHDVYITFEGPIAFTAYGDGRVFLEDFLAPFLRVGDGKEVYGRMVNVEGDGDQIVNQGGQLWIFGHKSENENTTFVTTDGGVTEVIGSYVISGTNTNIDPADNPLFEVVDAAFAISYREQNTGAVIDPFTVQLRETRGGVTRELANGPQGLSEMLFASYTDDLVQSYRGDGTSAGTRSATDRIDAEDFVATGGTFVEPTSGQTGVVRVQNRTVIGSVRDGDWAQYGDVDFGGGVGQVTVRYAAPRDGVVQLRSGTPDGPLLGAWTIRPTGFAFENFRTQTFDLPTINGVHDLHLVFTGAGTNPLMDIDTIQFIDAATPLVRSATDRIEAEDFSAIDPGIGVFAGGTILGSINNGETVTYSHLDFGSGVDQFTLRHGSPRASTIDLIVDGPDGQTIQTINVASTGSFGNLVETKFDLTPLRGIGDLTLRFGGGTSGLIDVDSFVFS